MSLVNDMLNDLDARRAKQPKPELDLDWLLGNRQKSRVKKNRLQFIPVIIALVGITVATIYYKPWQLIKFSEGEYQEPKKLPSVLPVVPQYAGRASIEKKTLPALSKPSTPVELEIQVQDERAESLHEALTKPDSSLHKNSVVQNVNAVIPKTGTVDMIKNSQPKLVADKSLENPSPQIQQDLDNQQQKSLATTLPVIKKVLPLTEERRDQKVAKEALNKMRSGLVQDAITTLQKQLHSKPDSIHSGKLLISLLLSQQRFVEADQLLQQMQSGYTRDIGLMVMRARMYLQSDEPEKALTYLQQQQPSLLEYPTYYEMQATAAQRSGDYQLARKTYASLLRVDGSRADWWFGLAVAFDAQAENNHALVAYQRALGQRGLTRTLQDYANRRVDELAGAG